MKCDKSCFAHRESFINFFHHCLSLQSYSHLYKIFDCDPETMISQPSIALVEQSILNALKFQIWQISPYDAVLDIFASFGLVEDVQNKETHLMIIEAIFNSYLL